MPHTTALAANRKRGRAIAVMTVLSALIVLVFILSMNTGYSRFAVDFGAIAVCLFTRRES